MVSTVRSTSPAESRQSESRLGQLLRIVRQLPAAYRIHNERQALMGLSDSTLKDIGLSRADAFREASKPWWQIPGNR
jgi:uncharacterized protein YjiS (DUF1127 family)